jgi:Caspase domain
MLGITYILIIAVEEYMDIKNFPIVNFASKDADDLKEAFLRLGFDKENLTILKNENATRTTIIQHIKTICNRTLDNDRIILYFSGHGFYEGGQNLIAPVDAVKIDKLDTCISINTILGYLKKALTKQTILFLDCCHSGFQPGENIRSEIDSFMADELLYQFSKEEYCVGFASCKSNQKSISTATLKNGVWSHFLIKALSGKADGVYEKGILFSDRLQSYLTKETSQYVKMNTTKRYDQTPIKFGNETNKFIIADINPILVSQHQAIPFSVKKISFFSGTYYLIKNLPGFKKNSHNVPTYEGSVSNKFVQNIGDWLIENEINTITNSLIEKIKYKRNEIRPSHDLGSGSIETNDFDYSITISQAEGEPSQAVLIRRMEFIENYKLFENPHFDSIFDSHFDNIVFDIFNEISIPVLVDKIEELDETSGITVSYDALNLSNCFIKIQGLEYTIEVSPSNLCISTGYKTNLSNLMLAFKKTYQSITSKPELKMIDL